MINQTISQDRVDLFETMSVGRAVAKLSVPTVFGTLVMILYNLADTYFVGMLSDPIQSSAVTLVAPVILLFNFVNNLFGTGTASLMSRSLGVKDYDTVRRTSAFGFYAALLSGALFSLLAIVLQNPLLTLLGSGETDRAATLAYMRWTVFFGAAPAILNVVIGNMVRSEGSVMHATLGTVSGCVLNIILDPFFILPQYLNMGAAGAGLATFISNMLATGYFLVYIAVKRGRTFVCIHPRMARPRAAIMRDVFGVGVPSAIQNLLNVTGMTILNNKMAVYGTEAVSAIGIAHKLTMIPMYVSMGIGQGVMPLIGYNYASGNRKRIRDALTCTLKASGILVLVLAGCFYAFSEPIMRAFMDHPLVVTYGSAFIRALSLATPFFTLDFLAVGVFQACGLGKYALYFAIARKIVLEIPAILLLDLIWPMYGIPYSQLCAELVLAVAAVILVKKITADPAE